MANLQGRKDLSTALYDMAQMNEIASNSRLTTSTDAQNKLAEVAEKLGARAATGAAVVGYLDGLTAALTASGVTNADPAIAAAGAQTTIDALIVSLTALQTP